MTQRSSSGRAETASSASTPRESSSRQSKLKAKIDEVKSPADGKPTDIKVPEKEQKSW